VNTGVITCLNAKSGEVVFGPERLEGLESMYASPVAAAGSIYFVGRNGTTVVIGDGEKLNILATNKLDDAIDASPALVGNEILLRGKEYLYCIAEHESRPPDAKESP
jgi:outer membrane protein assembly factor BamB